MSFFSRFKKRQARRTDARRIQTVTEVLLLYQVAEEQSLLSVNVQQRRVTVQQTYAARFTQSSKQLMDFLVGVGMYAYSRCVGSTVTDAIAKRELELLAKTRADRGRDLTPEEATICRMQAREGLDTQQEANDLAINILVVGPSGDPKVLAVWQDMKVDIVSVLDDDNEN